MGALRQRDVTWAQVLSGEIAPSPFGAVLNAAGAPRAQYPSRLLTMFFKGSPFSNLPYCFRKKRIA